MNININLLPWREALKEQQKKEYFSMLGLAVLLAVGLNMIIHMLVASKITFQEENNIYLKNEIQILDEKIAQINSLEKEKRQLLARMNVIQQLQASRPQVVQLFDSMARIIPKGMYLTNLSRKGDKIFIDGRAESNTRVSTFMRNIEASHWLTAPQLSLIKADEKDASGNIKWSDRLIGFNLQAVEVKKKAKKVSNTKLPSVGEVKQPIS